METNELVTGPTDGQVSSLYLQAVYEEVDCLGDCNMGAPCQTCGSNGQYIGRVMVQVEEQK